MATRTNSAPRTPAGKPAKVHTLAKATQQAAGQPTTPPEPLAINTKGTDGVIMESMIVDINKLVMQNQYRTIPTEEKALTKWKAGISELARNIAAEGLMQPIAVRRDAGRLVIVFGHRRYLACLEAGLKKIQVVIDTSPLEDILARRVNENRLRLDPPLLDTARGIRQIFEVMPKPQAKNTAIRLGMTPAEVSKFLLLTDEGAGGPKTVKGVADGILDSLDSAYTVAMIERIDPAEAQAVIDNYSNENRKSILARYNALKAGLDQQIEEIEENKATKGNGAAAPAEQVEPEEIEEIDEEWQAAVDYLASGEARETIEALAEAVPRLPKGMGAKIERLLEAVAVFEATALSEAEIEGEGEGAQAD